MRLPAQELKPQTPAGIAPKTTASASNNPSSEPFLRATDEAVTSTEEVPSFERFSNGIRSLEHKHLISAWLLPLLENNPSAFGCGVIYNHCASGIEKPAPDEVNLLADAPEEVSNANDLYFESYDQAAEAVATFERYAKAKMSIFTLVRKENEGEDCSVGPSLSLIHI